jgi:hypothetical protein
MTLRLALLALLGIVSTPAVAVMNDVDTRGHYNDRHDQRICRSLTRRHSAYDLCKLPTLPVVSVSG